MFFDFGPQTLLMIGAALAVGLFTASRSPGGLLGHVARSGRGWLVRGIIALVMFGGISLYANSASGGRLLGTADPLEKAQVGDCMKGTNERDADVVRCADDQATSMITHILRDTTAAKAMTQEGCAAFDDADAAFLVTELSADADHAVAYCTKEL